MANAGITRDQLMMRMSEEDFADVVQTNLAGSWRVAKRASKGMLRLRRGRVVFISSVVGLLGSAGQSNYAASKAGLVGLARSLARELGSRGITFNVVAPGFVETDMTAELGEELQATYQVPDPARPLLLRRRGRPRGALRRRATTRRTSPGPCCRSTAASAWVTDISDRPLREDGRWVCSTASASSSPEC